MSGTKPPAVDKDRVSVVIPSRGRPDLVVRAVHSALAQGEVVAEVVVVVDGPDAATMEALRSIQDGRLIVDEHDVSRGGGWARNRGVALASSSWVALLDDDDEWRPGKLVAQLACARSIDATWPIALCRILARSPDHSAVWPRRLPAKDEPFSEYLYVRHGLRAGEGAVQTSAILAPRAAFLGVPFDEDLRRHQDHDWLLRVLAVPGSHVAYDEGVYVVWHRDVGRQRITDFSDWRYSAGWARSRRALFTRRAYAAFLLVIAGDSAARERDFKGIASLYREARREGTIRLLDLVILAGKVMLPRGVRQRVRVSGAG